MSGVVRIDPNEWREPFFMSTVSWQSSHRDLNLEYRILRSLTETQDHNARLAKVSPEYESDNRYLSSLPFADNMVEVPGETYFNASWISCCEIPRRIIVCQAPMEKTKGAFWKMVGHHHVGMIICLSSEEDSLNDESHADHFVPYWPKDLSSDATSSSGKVPGGVGSKPGEKPVEPRHMPTKSLMGSFHSNLSTSVHLKEENVNQGDTAVASSANYVSGINDAHRGVAQEVLDKETISSHLTAGKLNENCSTGDSSCSNEVRVTPISPSSSPLSSGNGTNLAVNTNLAKDKIVFPVTELLSEEHEGNLTIRTIRVTLCSHNKETLMHARGKCSHVIAQCQQCECASLTHKEFSQCVENESSCSGAGSPPCTQLSNSSPSDEFLNNVNNPNISNVNKPVLLSETKNTLTQHSGPVKDCCLNSLDYSQGVSIKNDSSEVCGGSPLRREFNDDFFMDDVDPCVANMLNSDDLNLKSDLLKCADCCSHNVLHVRYGCWNDMSSAQPQSVAKLVTMIQNYFASHPTRPIVVHCSAGVGRAGTLVATVCLAERMRIDALNHLNKLESEKEMYSSTNLEDINKSNIQKIDYELGFSVEKKDFSNNTTIKNDTTEFEDNSMIFHKTIDSDKPASVDNAYGGEIDPSVTKRSTDSTAIDFPSSLSSSLRASKIDLPSAANTALPELKAVNLNKYNIKNSKNDNNITNSGVSNSLSPVITTSSPVPPKNVVFPSLSSSIHHYQTSPPSSASYPRVHSHLCRNENCADFLRTIQMLRSNECLHNWVDSRGLKTAFDPQLSVLSEVLRIRSERPNLVATTDQYRLIYAALELLWSTEAVQLAARAPIKPPECLAQFMAMSFNHIDNCSNKKQQYQGKYEVVKFANETNIGSPTSDNKLNNSSNINCDGKNDALLLKSTNNESSDQQEQQRSMNEFFPSPFSIPTSSTLPVRCSIGSLSRGFAAAAPTTPVTVMHYHQTSNSIETISPSNTQSISSNINYNNINTNIQSNNHARRPVMQQLETTRTVRNVLAESEKGGAQEETPGTVRMSIRPLVMQSSATASSAASKFDAASSSKVDATVRPLSTPTCCSPFYSSKFDAAYSSKFDVTPDALGEEIGSLTFSRHPPDDNTGVEASSSPTMLRATELSSAGCCGLNNSSSANMSGGSTIETATLRPCTKNSTLSSRKNNFGINISEKEFLSDDKDVKTTKKVFRNLEERDLNLSKDHHEDGGDDDVPPATPWIPKKVW